VDFHKRYDAYHQEMARAVREGKPPLVTGEEHKKAVEIICAIYQSAQTGKPVKLPLKRFRSARL